jgi:hypothetical protein
MKVHPTRNWTRRGHTARPFPPHVKRALKRLHGRLDVVWNKSFRRWQIIERGRSGMWHHVLITERVPTKRNTLYRLMASDARTHGKNHFARESALAAMDARTDAMVAERNKFSRERVLEGHDAAWNAVLGRKVVGWRSH